MTRRELRTRICACGCGEEIRYQGKSLRVLRPSETRRRERCQYINGHYGKVHGAAVRVYRSRREYSRASRAVLDKLGMSELRARDPSKRKCAKILHTPFGPVVCESQGYLVVLCGRVRAKIECGDPNGLPCDVCRKYAPQRDLAVYQRKTRSGTIAFHRSCKAFRDAERKRQKTAQRRYNRVWKASAFREGR